MKNWKTGRDYQTIHEIPAAWMMKHIVMLSAFK
jgi:hypothetical protein